MQLNNKTEEEQHLKRRTHIMSSNRDLFLKWWRPRNECTCALAIILQISQMAVNMKSEGKWHGVMQWCIRGVRVNCCTTMWRSSIWLVLGGRWGGWLVGNQEKLSIFNLLPAIKDSKQAAPLYCEKSRDLEAGAERLRGQRTLKENIYLKITSHFMIKGCCYNGQHYSPNTTSSAGSLSFSPTMLVPTHTYIPASLFLVLEIINFPPRIWKWQPEEEEETFYGYNMTGKKSDTSYTCNPGPTTVEIWLTWKTTD